MIDARSLDDAVSRSLRELLRRPGPDGDLLLSCSEGFLRYCRYGWVLPWRRSWWSRMAGRCLRLVEASGGSAGLCRSLLLSKHGDYGAAPLLATGLFGVAVRCVSKVMRAVNIRDRKGGFASHESLADTYADLYNYCLLALVMIDGGLG